MSNPVIENDKIVYFLTLSHGSILGKDKEGEFVPHLIKIPKRIYFFNKITQVSVGYGNLLSNKLNKTVLDKYISEFRKFEQLSQPIIHDQLGDLVSTFSYLSKQRSEIKSAIRTGEIFERIEREHAKFLLKNRQLHFESIMNRTSTNKLFSRSFRDDASLDIHVVFQKGGKFNIGDKILESRPLTNTYGVNGQLITLKELLNLSLKKGYNKVVMIDMSCESCYKREDYTMSHDYSFIDSDNEDEEEDEDKTNEEWKLIKEKTRVPPGQPSMPYEILFDIAVKRGVKLESKPLISELDKIDNRLEQIKTLPEKISSEEKRELLKRQHEIEEEIDRIDQNAVDQHGQRNLKLEELKNVDRDKRSLRSMQILPTEKIEKIRQTFLKKGIRGGKKTRKNLKK